jgi:tetratricopeptide (TPR) repeat protein
MATDPERVKTLFLAAIERGGPADRRAFLDSAVGDNAELRDRLDALLAAYDQPLVALDGPLAADPEATDAPNAAPSVSSPTAGGIGGVGPTVSQPKDDGPSLIDAVIADRYKIRQEIGDWGMGTVYIAEQLRPVRRQVALKLIKPGMDSRNVLARFESERQALALMDHSKIARVLDAGTGPDGHPFFVMELVKGIPITEYCDAHRLDLPARLWDAATGQPIGQPMRHEGRVLSVAFSPDGKTILTGCLDKTARLWDAATGQPVGSRLLHGQGVWVVGCSPDGKLFLTKSEDGIARLWNAATGEPIGRPFRQLVVNSSDGAEPVSFSPDGKTLLTGCEDGSARLWDLETRTLRTAPLRHHSWVSAVAFSPDGTTILTGDWDKTARLWDAATGMPLGPPIPHPGRLSAVAFSPDGNSFLTGDSAARLFRKVPELPDDLERVATWAEVLTGLTLDKQQGLIQVLDNAAWRERREQLEKQGGPLETEGGPRLDPIPFGTDPIARGRVLVERGRWDEAEAAFDEAVRARPYNASSWAARAEYFSARGQHQNSVADFVAARETDPDIPQLHYRVAIARLLAGDLTGYREACTGMLARFKTTQHPFVANRVAYACIYAPGAVVDMPGLIQVAERSVPARAGGERIVGAALYRAGRYQDALRCFEQARKVREPRAWDWLFLCMIQGGLGHAEEARRMLARAGQWIAEADRAKPGTSRDNESTWTNSYEKPTILLLLREAEAVILYDPIFPADPFAP